MEPLPDSLRVVLQQQDGLVTTAQVLGAGVPRGQLRWALERRWQLVHRGVVVTTTGALTPHQRLVAAQLFAGEGAYLAATTAARWHGVESAGRDTVVRMTAAPGRESKASPGVLVRRTHRPDARPWRRGPLLISSPARAVADAARLLRGDAVRAVVVEALQRRLVTTAQLVSEVELGPRRGSASVRAAVLTASGGAWSLPEVALLDLLRGSRSLPGVRANPLLLDASGDRLPRPDAWIDDVALAVQVHSRRHHCAEDDWRATLRTDTALGAAGVAVLAFTPREIATEPARVLASVESAHRNLAARGGRPAVVAVGG
ncbi:hypothetical protein [Kineococcus rubinsiae]|uniref:hypothetical protein n=1 Tax=Kineococcus rubinsiae TaxID=2609562 RepID=UPI001431163B|nr:hypothetical protein [Kineococcus rubinsiae]NIZ92672.1 hypothetical protein [Kineococcus rubinsiae]